MIRVRRVDTSDPVVRAGVDSMIAECFTVYDWSDLKLPRCTAAYGEWWVAFKGKVPVGFVGVVDSTKVPNALYLFIVGVIPSARGDGIQKRLTKKVLRYARERGRRYVVSDTVNTNVASMRSFVRSGFIPFRPDDKWGSPHAVYWIKSV